MASNGFALKQHWLKPFDFNFQRWKKRGLLKQIHFLSGKATKTLVSKWQATNFPTF